MARPKLFSGVKAQKIVSMVEKFGAAQTAEILGSRSDAELASLRDKRVFPSRVSVSVPTICRIAREGGLVLSVGRGSRPVRAEVQVVQEA
jgi:hypothetical protein